MRRISSAPLRGGNPANSSARRNPARRTGRSEEKDGIVILKGNSLGGQPAAPAPFSAGLAGRFNVMLSFSRRKKRSSGLNVGKFPNNQIGKTTERWEPRRSRDKAVRRNWRRVASVPETARYAASGPDSRMGLAAFPEVRPVLGYFGPLQSVFGEE